jgi:hypothetical protein
MAIVGLERNQTKNKTMTKNYGFNLQKELREQSDEDWVFGSDGKVTKGIGGEKEEIKSISEDVAGVITACHAWSGKIINGIYQRTTAGINHCIISWIEKLKEYYPIGEVQNWGQEKFDCVTRGFINELEKMFNYFYKNNLFSESTLYFLNKHNFIIDGKIVLSNRIPAKGSGTTMYGNSLKAVIQWIENNGIFPRSILPEDKPMTFNEYYGFTMKDEWKKIGKESKKYIKINYGKVYERNFLKYFGNFKWKIFDNYVDSYDGDFVKHLAKDYIYIGYGYKLIISELEADMIETFEITDDQVRRAWLSRADLQKEFPSPAFVSIHNPKYTIYQWARDNGKKEMPHIFSNPIHKTPVYDVVMKEIISLWNKFKGLIKIN